MNRLDFDSKVKFLVVDFDEMVLKRSSLLEINIDYGNYTSGFGNVKCSFFLFLMFEDEHDF